MPVVVYFTVDGYFSSLLFGTVTNNADVNILTQIFCANVQPFFFGVHISPWLGLHPMGLRICSYLGDNTKEYSKVLQMANLYLK